MALYKMIDFGKEHRDPESVISCDNPRVSFHLMLEIDPSIQIKMEKIMKKYLTIFIALTSMNFLMADDHVEFGAMEGLQCNFADGKDMGDVMKVISEWNEYGDENFSAPYSAWIFTFGL